MCLWTDLWHRLVSSNCDCEQFAAKSDSPDELLNSLLPCQTTLSRIQQTNLCGWSTFSSASIDWWQFRESVGWVWYKTESLCSPFSFLEPSMAFLSTIGFGPWNRFSNMADSPTVQHCGDCNRSKIESNTHCQWRSFLFWESSQFQTYSSRASGQWHVWCGTVTQSDN